jgi:hypothetical protein
MRTSNALRKLIDSDCDSERMLRHESAFVTDLRWLVLQRLANERHASAQRLRGAYRGRPLAAGDGSWIELWRELARSVRVAVGGPDGGDAVAACRRAIGRVEALYDRALELSWPRDIRALLLDQLENIRRARRELVQLQY